MRRSLLVFRGLLRNSAIMRMLIAWLLFVLAEYSVWIGMLVYAYARGGPTTAGVIAVAQLVPGIVIAPLVATLADRCSPTLLLVVSLVVQTVGMAMTAVAIYANWPPVTAYAAAVVAATSVTATRPALAVMVPALAHEADELTASNAAQGWLDSLGIVGSGLVTGFALASHDVGLIFAFGAGATAIATVLVIGIRVVAMRPEEADDNGGALIAFKQGWQVLRARPAARLLVGLITAQFVVIGALDLLFVLLAVSVLDAGAEWTGYLNTAYGVGGVLGGVVAAGLLGRRLAGPLVASGAIISVALSLTAVSHRPSLTVLLLVVTGLGRSIIDIATRTLLQRTVPPDQLGRVFGDVEGLSGLGLAIGSLLVPAFHALGGATLALVGAALVIPACGVLGGRALFRLDSSARVPIVEIALLRSMPHFRALPTPELEGLASAAQRRTYADGHTIIRQGDPGDDFYAIAEGRVSVFVDNSFVTSRARPEGLGEIALLHEVPRSATIVADGPVVLYALDGATFVSVVTGHQSTRRRAEAVADARLASGQPPTSSQAARSTSRDEAPTNAVSAARPHATATSEHELPPTPTRR
jgi:CRP-like cAMP-binding protein